MLVVNNSIKYGWENLLPYSFRDFRYVVVWKGETHSLLAWGCAQDAIDWLEDYLSAEVFTETVEGGDEWELFDYDRRPNKAGHETRAGKLFCLRGIRTFGDMD